MNTQKMLHKPWFVFIRNTQAWPGVQNLLMAPFGILKKEVHIVCFKTWLILATFPQNSRLGLRNYSCYGILVRSFLFYYKKFFPLRWVIICVYSNSTKMEKINEYKNKVHPDKTIIKITLAYQFLNCYN